MNALEQARRDGYLLVEAWVRSDDEPSVHPHECPGGGSIIKWVQECHADNSVALYIVDGRMWAANRGWHMHLVYPSPPPIDILRHLHAIEVIEDSPEDCLGETTFEYFVQEGAWDLLQADLVEIYVLEAVRCSRDWVLVAGAREE